MNSTQNSLKRINQAGIALGIAFILTTIHHIYGGIVDDAINRLLVPFIMAVPLLISLALLYQYRRSHNLAILITYAILVVIAFVLLLGLLHGGYAHLYKDILFLLNSSPSLYYSFNPNEHYPPDNLFFEFTGVLDFAASLFVAWTTVKLFRDRQNSKKERN